MEETIHPKDTEAKIINLFNRAKKSILMSTGLNSEFYNYKDVKEAMESAFKKVDNVKIIITEDIESKQTEISWLFSLAKEFEDKIQIRYYKNALHWIIIDDKHIRLEKPHSLGGVGQQNLFECNVPQIVAEILKKKFYSWWTSENILSL